MISTILFSIFTPRVTPQIGGCRAGFIFHIIYAWSWIFWSCFPKCFSNTDQTDQRSTLSATLFALIRNPRMGFPERRSEGTWSEGRHRARDAFLIKSICCAHTSWQHHCRFGHQLCLQSILKGIDHQIKIVIIYSCCLKPIWKISEGSCDSEN